MANENGTLIKNTKQATILCSLRYYCADTLLDSGDHSKSSKARL